MSDLIKSKLKQSKSKKLFKMDRYPSTITTLQIAKEDSNHYHTYISLVEGRESCIVLHYGRLPPTTHLEDFNSGRGWIKVHTTDAIFNTIKSGINSYKDLKHYHTQPYSHLLAYCLGREVDLIKEGILEL